MTTTHDHEETSYRPPATRGENYARRLHENEIVRSPKHPGTARGGDELWRRGLKPIDCKAELAQILAESFKGSTMGLASLLERLSITNTAVWHDAAARVEAPQ